MRFVEKVCCLGARRTSGMGKIFVILWAPFQLDWVFAGKLAETSWA